MPKRKPRKQPVEILTVDECRALIRHCGRGETSFRNRAIIAVLWRAGLRVSECLDLRPKDVEIKTGAVRVLHGKGDRARTVGLDVDAMTHVERWLEKRRELGLPRSARLFCTLQGGRLWGTYIRQLLPRLARRAGIDKRVHAHAFRHTFAVELSNENRPLHVIQALLGHEDLTTTSGYLKHLGPREALDVIRSRPRWESVPGTDARQGVLALPEAHTTSTDRRAPPPQQTSLPLAGRGGARSVLALALVPKGRLGPKQ